ncbi:MAG: glycosyltransferase [Hyphomicrobiales bacterium]
MSFLDFFVIVTGFSCVIWIYLLVFHQRFWLSNQVLGGDDVLQDGEWPSVVVVIPARNEAETIGAVAKSHLANDYQGRLDLIVVDDQSSDGTGELVRALDDNRAHVIAGKDLPHGWSGKLWAVNNGLEAAKKIAPDADYVLLTDADIEHAPGTLAKLVTKAVREEQAMVSIMAVLDTRGFWGGLLMPAFIFFFQKLYPFPAINNPASKIGGAAGGCMLIERKALEAIGGVETIKGDLIDDCALGKALKDPKGAKRSIWLGFDEGIVSLRDNRELHTIWKMVARTAFTQLQFSSFLLIGSVIGMALTYLVAPIAFLTLPLHGSILAATLGALAYFGMTLAYTPTLRRYKKSQLWALILPLSAVVYMMMTVSSALNHWRGRGGAWKGRTYS